MNCPRCKRILIGMEQFCIVHGDTLDLLPTLSETGDPRVYAMSRAPLSVREFPTRNPPRRTPKAVPPCTAFPAHRWAIEEPDGALSVGRCECGAEREFENTFCEDGASRGWMQQEARRKSRELGKKTKG